ncbi:MAG: dihydroorotase [Ignavibacteriaceae bacterium]|nr:MAG: dihydroorotase [Ignavibacteriaceae bacterium]
MKTLLKNLHIIDPAHKLDLKADILIDDGVIEKIGTGIEVNDWNVDIHDLSGCVAAPGFLDMHVHLREPGREDEETVVTGCNGAAAGGFTAVACMPNTDPAIDSSEIVESILLKSKATPVDVYPIGAATLGRKGESLAPIGELVEAGAVGFSDDGVAIKTAKILRKVMEYSSMYDTPVIEHCEDESLAGGAMNEGLNSTKFGLSSVPPIAEDLIVARDIMMAEYTGARVHIAHISTAKAVQLVREGKAKGIKVTAEVAPHHFTLTDDALAEYDTNFKMNPPLRTKTDVEAMIAGLKDGTIDCIASDHAPHSPEEKEMEFEYAPNGILGLETTLGLTLNNLYHTGILTMEQIVEKLSINPRKILNIPLPKIAEGEKANLSIFDPNAEYTIKVSSFRSKSKNSPFDGHTLKGKPVAVFNKGKLVKS